MEKNFVSPMFKYALFDIKPTYNHRFRARSGHSSKISFGESSPWYTRIYDGTSLQTSMLPKTTWRPSKKLSPMMMTVVPPVVQPSFGQIALIVGVAVHRKPTHNTRIHRPSTLQAPPTNCAQIIRHTHTTVLRPSWILSGTTQVNWHQKGKTRMLKPLWIYWSKNSTNNKKCVKWRRASTAEKE